MSYIGKEPANSFISFAKQDFSTSVTTSYTLDNAVTNENELALFINFVRQEPTTGYTASGTTLTLTSATASGDDMYCVYLGQAKQTVNAPDGSVGNSQVASTIITGQTAETSIATDDTVLIHDTSAGALRKMTRANFVSGIGGTNTPAFQVYANANQTSLNHNTLYKVTLDTEDFDTDNAFASDKFTVPSGKGGKYFLGASLNMYAYNTSKLRRVQLYLFKNGSALKSTYTDFQSNDSQAITQNISGIFDLSASDYIEVYGKIRTSDSGNNNFFYVNDKSNAFWGYKIIE